MWHGFYSHGIITPNGYLSTPAEPLSADASLRATINRRPEELRSPVHDDAGHHPVLGSAEGQAQRRRSRKGRWIEIQVFGQSAGQGNWSGGPVPAPETCHLQLGDEPA